MTEQDLIGKTAKIVGVSVDGSDKAKGEWVAHICLDLGESGERVFVQATDPLHRWVILEDRRYDLESAAVDE